MRNVELDKKRINEELWKCIVEEHKKNGNRGVLTMLRNLVGARQDLRDNSGRSIDSDSRSALVGAVGELALKYVLNCYIKERGIKAKVFQSVITGDANNLQSSYATETDIVMVTPSVVLCFECKSYAGDITVVDKGKLLRSVGNNHDLYEQSRKHHSSMAPYLGKGMTRGDRSKPPICSSAFIFSNARLIDKRTEEWQRSFIILTLKDVYPYLDLALSKYQTPVYDFDIVCRLMRVSSNSKSLREKHKNYVGY